MFDGDWGLLFSPSTRTDCPSEISKNSDWPCLKNNVVLKSMCHRHDTVKNYCGRRRGSDQIQKLGCPFFISSKQCAWKTETANSTGINPCPNTTLVSSNLSHFWEFPQEGPERPLGSGLLGAPTRVASLLLTWGEDGVQRKSSGRSIRTAHPQRATDLLAIHHTLDHASGISTTNVFLLTITRVILSRWRKKRKKKTKSNPNECTEPHA